MMKANKEFLWVEAYRPVTIEDTILPNDLKKTFSEIIKSGEVPNMLFAGTAGVGKTTVAKAICKELDLDYLIINGSENGNIDTLRTTIKQFASTVSLQGGYKVVILDEADYLNPQSTQPALRGFIEEFSNNCRFILTCNFRNRIIEPLHSRCSVYDFSIPSSQKPAIAGGIFKRTAGILNKEGVEYDKKVLAELVQRYFPDFRRILNECQRYSISGKIDTGILVNLGDESFNNLLSYLKDKNFKLMRKWVADNIDTESHVIFRRIYDSMSASIAPQSIPTVVLIIADYQFKDAFCADKEINIVACMTEIMSSTEFK
jgi:DNA polymerase III delta prime subunit